MNSALEQGFAATQLCVPAERPSDGARWLKRERETLVWSEWDDAHAGRLVVKLYRRRRLSAYLRGGLGNYRSEREYRILSHLSAHGIPCSPPVLWSHGFDRVQGFYDELVTREIADTLNLEEWLEQRPADASPPDLSELLAILRRMHACGCYHGVLKPSNILVPKRAERVTPVILIDMDMARVFSRDLAGTWIGRLDLLETCSYLWKRFGNSALAGWLPAYGLRADEIEPFLERLARYAKRSRQRRRLARRRVHLSALVRSLAQLSRKRRPQAPPAPLPTSSIVAAQPARAWSTQEIGDFERDGFVVVRGLFSAEEIGELARAIDALVARGPRLGAEMFYYEDSLLEQGARVLSRIERFAGSSPSLARFVQDERITRRAEELLGEPAQLFKEKVNFKLPGGGGFAAHQDIQPGWDDYAPYFISVLVTVDESTLANGCLELSAGHHKRGMLGAKWKPLTAEELEGVEFVAYPMQPGDVAFFDCFVPHQSKPNLTDRQRRNLYLTFNRASDGDRREQYFADKRKSYPPDNEREPGKSYSFKV